MTMYISPPNTQMTNRYSRIRSKPSTRPKRVSPAGIAVTTSPTTVVAVAPSVAAASVVCVVTSSVKLNVPRLLMLRLITHVTVHCPGGGSEASGAETVCMSTAITGAPSDTVTPSQRIKMPSAAASSASSLLRKMSCSCVGTTVTVELGCGFDEISSLGMLESAPAGAPMPAPDTTRNNAPTTATSGDNTARRRRPRTSPIGVNQRYPSEAVESPHLDAGATASSHRFVSAPEG